MLEKIGPLKDDDLIFIGRTGQPLDPHVIWQIFQNSISTTYSPNDLRDLFKYYLQQAKVDGDIQDWMMGHTGKMGATYAPSKETVVEEYRRLMPLVSVNGETIMSILTGNAA